MDQFVKPVANLICLFCANPPQPVFSPPPIKSKPPIDLAHRLFHRSCLHRLPTASPFFAMTRWPNVLHQ